MWAKLLHTLWPHKALVKIQHKFESLLSRSYNSAHQRDVIWNEMPTSTQWCQYCVNKEEMLSFPYRMDAYIHSQPFNHSGEKLYVVRSKVLLSWNETLALTFLTVSSFLHVVLFHNIVYVKEWYFVVTCKLHLTPNPSATHNDFSTVLLASTQLLHNLSYITILTQLLKTHKVLHLKYRMFWKVERKEMRSP